MTHKTTSLAMYVLGFCIIALITANLEISNFILGWYIFPVWGCIGLLPLVINTRHISKFSLWIFSLFLAMAISGYSNCLSQNCGLGFMVVIWLGLTTIGIMILEIIRIIIWRKIKRDGWTQKTIATVMYILGFFILLFFTTFSLEPIISYWPVLLIWSVLGLIPIMRTNHKSSPIALSLIFFFLSLSITGFITYYFINSCSLCHYYPISTIIAMCCTIIIEVIRAKFRQRNKSKE